MAAIAAAPQTLAAPGAPAAATPEGAIHDRITGLLTPILGAGRFTVAVAARIDHEKRTETAEIVDPDGQVLRRSEISGPAGPAGSASGTVTERTEYDVTRRVITTETDSPRVRRLTISVLIDSAALETGIAPVPEAATATGTDAARATDEAALTRLRPLIAAAAGIDEARGDTLALAALPFPAAARTPARPPLGGLAGETALATLALAVGGGLGAGLLGGMLMARRRTAVAPRPPVVSDPAMPDPAKTETALPQPAPVPLATQEDAASSNVIALRDLARRTPDRTAAVVKQWLSGEGPA